MVLSLLHRLDWRYIIWIAAVVLKPISMAQDLAPPQDDATIISNELFPDQCIFVNVTVDGRDASAILDTGSAHNVVNSRIRHWLEAPSGIAKADVYSGRLLLSKHRACVICVNTIALNSGEFCLATPLEHVEDVLGEKIDVVLGIQSFDDYVLELNYGSRTVGVSRKRLIANINNSLRLVRYGTALVAIPQVGLGSEETEDLMIDTGSNGCLSLKKSVFDRLVNSGEIYDLYRSLSADGKSLHDSEEGTLRKLDFNGIAMQNLPVTSSKDSSVGVDFLRRFDVRLDASNLVAVFEPNALFHDQGPTGKAGLGLATDNGKVVCKIIKPGSAAAEAGIEIGDRVVVVNGRNVADLKLIEVRRAIRGNRGDVVEIQWDRERSRVDTKMTLK